LHFIFQKVGLSDVFFDRFFWINEKKISVAEKSKKYDFIYSDDLQNLKDQLH